MIYIYIFFFVKANHRPNQAINSYWRYHSLLHFYLLPRHSYSCIPMAVTYMNIPQYAAFTHDIGCGCRKIM